MKEFFDETPFVPAAKQSPQRRQSWFSLITPNVLAHAGPRASKKDREIERSRRRVVLQDESQDIYGSEERKR